VAKMAFTIENYKSNDFENYSYLFERESFLYRINNCFCVHRIGHLLRQVAVLKLI
jgi:hypothetical protein